MAKKRMFSIDIVGSDAFLDLPYSAQCLYFQLGMRADDDGFVGNPKTIQRIAGTKASDLELLVKKRFLLQFPSGVVVIKHWKINNQIQKDRYTPTVYTEEYQSLYIKDNKAYTEMDAISIQDVSKMDTQVRDRLELGKDSIELDNNIPASEEKSSTASAKANKHKYGEYKNVLLKDEELQKLQKEYINREELIKYLDEYIEMKGYKAKSHYLCIKKWVVDAVKKENLKNPKKDTSKVVDF